MDGPRQPREKGRGPQDFDSGKHGAYEQLMQNRTIHDVPDISHLVTYQPAFHLHGCEGSQHLVLVFLYETRI